MNSRSTLTPRLQQTVHGGLSEETIDRSIDVVDNYYDHGNDVYIIDWSTPHPDIPILSFTRARPRGAHIHQPPTTTVNDRLMDKRKYYTLYGSESHQSMPFNNSLIEYRDRVYSRPMFTWYFDQLAITTQQNVYIRSICMSELSTLPVTLIM